MIHLMIRKTIKFWKTKFSKTTLYQVGIINILKCYYHRLIHKFYTTKMYRIRYSNKDPKKVKFSSDLWTFSDACKFMNTIQNKDSVEIVSIDGNVHFTLPSRKD